MAPAQPAPPTQAKKESRAKPGPCYNCDEHNHFANKCPKPRRAGPRFVQAHVNHASAEEAQAAPEFVLVVIEIQRSQFLANLILLESKDLDVILGMDWLTKFKGVIDSANRTVTLINEKGEIMVYKSPASPKQGVSLNQIKAEDPVAAEEKSPRKLEDIPVVCEYPEVFPEDLLPCHPRERSSSGSICVTPRFSFGIKKHSIMQFLEIK
uniref:Zinc knuckle, putative n=2 Tax=Oryza sativa subsp. japonica TaxID=39947 RepID=Q2R669_ORYSJ|nr:Zinc knuckle, putative [Oryza sativa Japonica Group]ABA93052.1 retrotransposon protein, putative, Ty3-gypsy subclass [Oryza sativa Japonica Group]